MSASVWGVAPPINPMIGFSIFLSPAERVAVRYSSGQSYSLIRAEWISLPPAQKKSLASSIASVTLVSVRSASSRVEISSPLENILSAKSSKNLSLLLLRLGKFVYPTMPIKDTASSMAVDFLLPLSPTSIAYMLGNTFLSPSMTYTFLPTTPPINVIKARRRKINGVLETVCARK